MNALISLFFIWMTVQFLIHTFFTYALHLPSSLSFIRVRKELIIGIVLAYITWNLITERNYRTSLLSSKWFVRIAWFVVLSIIISSANSIIIHHQWIKAILVSAKYNYTPLLVFLAWYAIIPLLTKSQYDKIVRTFIWTIKFVLIFSLFWYAILHTIPNGLSFLGYAKPALTVEWVAGMRPPSLYLTEFFTWFVRNQWPFWGPLSLGFYLAALRPFFYVLILYKKKWPDVRWWWILYIGMVASTFSRAAWWMFFLSSVILFVLTHRRHTKQIIITGILWVIAIGWYIMSGWTSELFVRKRSDQGHIKFFLQGLDLVKENRLRGVGAASVGPGAGHINTDVTVFNPENQYMQIWIEYGLFGLITRFMSYFLIFIKAISLLRKTWRNKKYKNIPQHKLLFWWIGISIITLFIAGIVLHPFVDSSSIYPFMMISGLLWGAYYRFDTDCVPHQQRPFNRKSRRKHLSKSV